MQMGTGWTRVALALTFLSFAGCASSGSSAPAPAPQAGASEDRARADGMRRYAQVIPASAVSDEGLFTVHMVGKKLFYEIPLSELEKEMLLLTRIARTANNIGYGGAKENTSVVRWQRHDDRILLRLVSHENVSADSLPIFDAVRNSNFEPIIQSFPIAAMSTDSSAVVIEVTSLFEKDVPLIGLNSRRRTQYTVRRMDESRTFILWAKSFPENVDVRRVLTYEAANPPSNSSGNTISLEMHHSLILLPAQPMTPRMWDERVGYFSVRQNDFGLDEQRAVQRRYITRWRLEPTDPAAHARGELVEPVKPIIYYIDAATPEKWRPFLKQGVEDWNVAFEAAGFRNAIRAMDMPTPAEDPDFHPEDMRYSVIRYLASTVQNASGPHVNDPRTGEILSSDIQWYHNVMNLTRNWYFTQTAAANPEARGVKFDDDVMGELIRFVAAHEVGHTLGLPHNMKSSAAYPVDSLRTSFTCRMGTAPSIMDYARFNYVAQPGDDACFMPQVGPYDRYSINWGYRPIPTARTTEGELATLRRWILDTNDDPLYRFGDPGSTDPSSLTEALGDDAVRASDYGIENLKRNVANLRAWTFEEGEDYSQLQELYGQTLGQWNRYTGHVTANVGGVFRNRKAQGQEGYPYEVVPEAIQRASVDYLGRQVFATPSWMLDQDILYRIQDSGALDRIRQLQLSALMQVTNIDRMKRLIEQEAMHGSSVYSLNEMLDDVRSSIWSELPRGHTIDPYRRNLQRGYLARMESLMGDSDAVTTDIAPSVRGQLERSRRDIRAAVNRSSDRATRLHLEDALIRVEAILDGEK